MDGFILDYFLGTSLGELGEEFRLMFYEKDEVIKLYENLIPNIYRIVFRKLYDNPKNERMKNSTTNLNMP